METLYTPTETRTFSGENISLLVEQFLGTKSMSVNNNSNLQRWEPYLRKVLRQGAFRQRPETWQDYARSQSFQSPYVLVALNPQPLPPRYSFMIAILQELIDRVVLVHEIAFTMNQGGQEQSIIIVGGSFDKYIDDVDELCPLIEQYFPKPNGGKEPGPHPNWDHKEFLTVELLIAADLFKQNALNIENEKLRDELLTAGKKLSNRAFDRI